MENKQPVNLKPVNVQFEAPRKRKVSAPLAARVLRWSGAAMITASAVVFGMATWEIVGSDISAGKSQDRLAEQFEAQANGEQGSFSSPAQSNYVDDGSVSPALLTSDATFADPLFGSGQLPGTVIDEASSDGGAELFERKAYGEVAGKISIPAIDEEFFVVFGTDYNALTNGPGVWEYGVVPGNPGNATIAGHRTTYGAPFRHLDSLNPGDRIYFEVPGRQTSVFEVRGSEVVLPDNVSVTYQTEGVRLTLTTCTPVGSTRERLIIQAELVEGEFVDQALPSSEWSFQGDI